jgi:hypothetical protein
VKKIGHLEKYFFKKMKNTEGVLLLR